MYATLPKRLGRKVVSGENHAFQIHREDSWTREHEPSTHIPHCYAIFQPAVVEKLRLVLSSSISYTASDRSLHFCLFASTLLFNVPRPVEQDVRPLRLCLSQDSRPGRTTRRVIIA